MKQFGVKDFLFWSESFTINNQFSCQVAEEIIHRKLQIRWVCNSRVDNVSEELLSLIRKAGCWMIGYGVESANQGVLDSVKKGINTEDTILAVTLAKKAGLEVTAHCILGFPQDTKETIKETINFVKKLPIDYAQFYCAVPFPGSILFEEASRAGWVCSDDWRRFEQNFSVLNTPNLSAGEIMKLRNLAYTSFYFRPQKAIKILNNIKSIPQAIALVKGVFDFLRWM